MPILWTDASPALPGAFLVGSVRWGAVPGAVRFETDRGPAPLRRRFAVAVRPYSGAMAMTGAQIGALRTFYETTTAMGTLQFTMFDPLGGADLTVRFVAGPEAELLDFALYRATLALEALP